jgi:hypothetical protein
MQRTQALQLLLQARHQNLGNHRDAILVAFAPFHVELTTLHIQMMHPQTQ